MDYSLLVGIHDCDRDDSLVDRLEVPDDSDGYNGSGEQEGYSPGEEDNNGKTTCYVWMDMAGNLLEIVEDMELIQVLKR